MTDNLPPLSEVLRVHGLRARKSLGQNFLLDLNLTRRIARAAGPLEGVTVIEVGPGPGGLTRALLAEGAARVIAIEKDPRCLQALAQIEAAYPSRVTVIEGDALKVDLAMLAKDAPPGPVRVVANLPYNIATPLVVGWLDAEPWPPWYDRLILMFQREVAVRMVARSGSRDYGRLSVLAQSRSAAAIAFEVNAKAFTPAPKVTSAIVELVPRADSADPALRQAMKTVTSAAFGQRRKMLRSALKSTGVDPLALLAAAEIEPTWRAENVSLEGFARLAAAYVRLAGAAQ